MSKPKSTVTIIYQHPAGKPPIFRSDLDAAVWSVAVGAYATIPKAQAAYAALRERYPIATRVHWLTHVGNILTRQRKQAPTAQNEPGKAKSVAKPKYTRTRKNA